MVYTHRNIAEEREEAHLKAQQLTAICEQLSITLDPIDWQNAGMRAWVAVNAVKVDDLSNFRQQDSVSVLRRVQAKLLEDAALKTMRPRPGLKTLVWSPVDVVQPQEFLSLWILTMENDERVAVVEYLKNGQRVYEPYTLDVRDKQQLAQLFGPVNNATYHLGDIVTIEEREKKCTGEIVYILSPGKALTGRRYLSRGPQNASSKVPAYEVASRYLVDCHDGFPHIVSQSQIAVSEVSQEKTS